MASSNTSPETLRVTFRAFQKFGPRVSRVSLISVKISELGFLQTH
jgi:hypothetical protein